jgi:hypothetical protein
VPDLTARVENVHATFRIVGMNKKRRAGFGGGDGGLRHIYIPRIGPHGSGLAERHLTGLLRPAVCGHVTLGVGS